MSSSSSPEVTGITLDELLAFNEEIASLVRAGVPLEFGLGELGRDLPGRLGQAATRVAGQLQSGRPMVEVLADPQFGIPPLYRAVIAAGLRSGRLPSALEAVAVSARRLADLRQIVTASLVYPLLVAMIGWGLMAFFAAKVAPVLVPSLAAVCGGSFGKMLLDGIARWGEWAWYWGPTLPAAVMLGAGLWWFVSQRATLAQPRRARMLLGWLPWSGSVLRLSTVTAFCEILTVLVEHCVPLDEALRLTAEAVQDPDLELVARQWGESLRQGQTSEPSHGATQGFPPLLAWLMTLGQQRSALPGALRHAADAYRRRVELQAQTARTFLPVLVTAIVGGGACATLALAVFYPWMTLLYHLAGIK